MLQAAARSPAMGPAHSPATPQAFPCPRARNAPTPKATPDAQPPRATTPSRNAGKRRKARQGCALRHSRKALVSAAGIRRGARQRSAARRSMVEFHENTRTHPVPRASAHSPPWAPRPLPYRAPGAPLLTSPQHLTPKTTPDATPLNTTTQSHLLQTEGQRSAEGAAGMYPEAQHGSDGKRGRDPPEARQRSAGRRRMVEFPEKSQIPPMPWAIARSPAVGPAHSPTAPPALSCPRARNTPYPPKTPKKPATPRRRPEPTHKKAPKGAA